MEIILNTVVCVKWGSLYDADYVNNLYAMVKRNLTLPFRFVCFTDDPTGFHPDIESKCLPDHLKGWWGKIYYFKTPLEDITGTVLAIDLDMVIVDNIDCFFEYNPADFVMRNNKPGPGVSSCVMRFDANQYKHIYDELDLDNMDHAINNRNVSEFKGKRYPGDQDWIREQMSNDPLCRKVKIWPKTWVPRFLMNCHREKSTKMLYTAMQTKERKLGKPLVPNWQDNLEFFLPKDAKILAFAGYHQNNKAYYDTIKHWWHAEDL